MRKTIVPVLVWLGVLAAATSYGQPVGVDPGTPDSVRVDSVAFFSTDPGIVPVRFYNDEALGGIELTLTYSSPDITLDSFSFVGGRAEYVSLKGASLGPGTITVYCFPFTGEPLISPGNGLLGNFHFSYLPTIPGQVVPIDTITFSVGNREYATTFSDGTANPFSPQYETGYLEILSSCCIGIRGNVDNDPSDLVNVADLTYLVAYLFQGGPDPVCLPEGNVDGDPGETINVADLTYLVAYLFQGGPDPPPCF
jgi:hypothetical protein